MSQFARPVEDISNTGFWAFTPFWDKLDEIVNDEDTTVVRSLSRLVNDSFIVKLSPSVDPLVSSGHVLRFWGKNLFAPMGVTLRIYQGASTLIATAPEITLSGGVPPVVETYTLTTGEADSITDYSDLRVEVEMTDVPGIILFTAGWIEFEVPNVPFTPPVRTTIDSIIHPRNVDSVILKDEELNSIMNT